MPCTTFSSESKIPVLPKYLTLFENETYCNMLNTLLKPEMVKPMIMLNKELVVNKNYYIHLLLESYLQLYFD